MIKERWVWVPGYEGRYRVSTLGKVRSVTRVTHRNGRKYHAHSRNMTLISSRRNPYLRVVLTGPDGANTHQVHSLVLLAFRGPCPAGKQSRHLNGIGSDNRLSNLRYGTVLENAADRIRHGTFARKLNLEDVVSIRESGVEARHLAKGFGVTTMCVQHVLNRKTWQHI